MTVTAQAGGEGGARRSPAAIAVALATVLALVGLAVGAVVIGSAFAIAFDQAFTIFHDLLFPAGNWEFDPATDRLVQLFPYDFWTETSVAIAVVGLLLTLATWAFARRMARRSA